MTGIERWANRTLSQLIVIPGVLSLIGIGIGDTLDAPQAALVATVVVILVAIAFSVILDRRAERRQRALRLSEGEEYSDQRRCVVVGLSHRLDSWEDHPVNFLHARTGATHFGIVVTTAAQDAFRHLEELVRTNGREIHLERRDLSSEDLTNVSAIRDTFARLIEKVATRAEAERHDLLVDITGATAVMSVGAYAAATEAGTTATYIEIPSSPGKRLDLQGRRLRLVYDPSKSAVS